MEQDRNAGRALITCRRMLAAAGGITALGAASAAGAQVPNAPTQRRNGPVHISNEETVRSLDNLERLAALKRDVQSLQKLWSEELALNAPNNQVVIGRRAVLEAFVHTGVINFSSFERQVEFIRADGA